MIHMKFGQKSKSIRLESPRQSVWGEHYTAKLQKTSKGYYQINIPIPLKEELQFSDNAIIDLQNVNGSLVGTELKRPRWTK